MGRRDKNLRKLFEKRVQSGMVSFKMKILIHEGMFFLNSKEEIIYAIFKNILSRKIII